MEEARFILREMGVKVISPVLDDTINNTTATSILLIAEGLNEKVAEIKSAQSLRNAYCGIAENGEQTIGAATTEAGVTIVDDFSSALYLAAWAAAEHVT